MKDIRTHYENLKVARDAPPEVIKAAYRALAQKYHPDRNPGDRDAAEVTASLNHSYEVLMDPAARRAHDQWIDAVARAPGELAAPRGDARGTAMQGPDAAFSWPNHVRAAAHRLAKSNAVRASVAGGLAVLLIVAGVLKARERHALPESLWAARMAKDAKLTQDAEAADVQVFPIPALPAVPAAALVPLAFLHPERDAEAEEKSEPAENAAPEPPIVIAPPAAVPPTARVSPPTPVVAAPAAPAHEEACPDATAGYVLPRESYSGYLPDRPIGNADGGADLIIDNTATDHDALVKLVDLEQAATVRLFQVKAKATFTLQKLSPARYRLLYRYKTEGCTPYLVGEAFEINGKKAKSPDETPRTWLRPG